MNKKGFVNIGIVVALLIVAGIIGYSFATKKQSIQNPIKSQDIQTPSSDVAGVVNNDISNGETYNFKGSSYLPAMTFQYPSGWTIEVSEYKTPGQQDQGLSGDIEAILITPPIPPFVKTDKIFIGAGRQAQCNTENIKKGHYVCIDTFTPIWTNSTDVQIPTIFERIVQSIQKK